MSTEITPPEAADLPQPVWEQAGDAGTPTEVAGAPAGAPALDAVQAASAPYAYPLVQVAPGWGSYFYTNSGYVTLPPNQVAEVVSNAGPRPGPGGWCWIWVRLPQGRIAGYPATRPVGWLGYSYQGQPLVANVGLHYVAPCALYSRIGVGDRAMVTYEPNYPNVFYRGSIGGPQRALPAGTEMSVVSGPVWRSGYSRNGNVIFWQVRLNDGDTGWTGECDAGWYWLIPLMKA